MDESPHRDATSDSSAPARPWYRRRALVAAAALLLLYGAAGFQLAPWLVRQQVPRIATELFARPATIGEVRVNPFLLTFEARDFTFGEADGTPILAFDRLFVDLQVESLFRWAWTFAEVRLEGPALDLVHDADGRLNLARLADALPPPEASPEPETEPARPPRLLLKHVVFSGGRVSFTDRANPTPASATLAPLDLELRELTTLPERHGPYRLSAALPEGGTIAWQGDVSLNPIASHGKVRVGGFRPALAWRFFQDRVRLAEPEGTLDAELAYAFGYADGAVSLTVDPARLAASNLMLARPGADTPLLALGTFALEGGRFDLATRSFTAPTLALRDGRVTAGVEADGSLDWATLVAAEPVAEPAPEPAAAEAPADEPWRVHVDAVTLDGLALGFRDASRTAPLAFAAGGARLGLTFDAALGGATPQVGVTGLALALDTISGRTGDGTPLLDLASVTLDGGRFDLASRSLEFASLALRDGRVAARVDADGTVDWASPSRRPAPPAPPPDPAQPPWRIRVAAASLDGVALDYTDASRAIPINVTAASSRLALAAEAAVGGAETGLVVDGIELALDEVDWTEVDGAPLLALDRLAFDGGRLDLSGPELTLERIALTGGRANLRRDADGSMRQVTALFPAEQGKVRRELAEARAEAAAEGRPWQLAIGEVALDGFEIDYEDGITEPPVAYALKEIDIKISDIRPGATTPIAYAATLETGSGGHAEARGTAAQDGAKVDTEVTLERISAKPLASLLYRVAALDLVSGAISAQARVGFSAGDKGPELRVRGTLGVDDLLVNEAATGDRFLAWQKLAANGVDFSLNPDHLKIKEVRIGAPGAKVLIAEDRSVNLVEVLKHGEGAAAPEAAAGTATDAPPFPVSIGRVHLEQGVVDFADLSLVLPFATRVSDFGGSVTGIAPGPEARAQLAFEGRVGEFGEAVVGGQLAALDPKHFTDVQVTFRNVAMDSLSPYSATFAGRTIASGKLDLDLQYKVESSELRGDNKVMLREFTLGERVESPDAADLPLDLAIALLSDGQGRIEAAIPVSGNVDHPEFSLGGIIGKAIGNLILKIVTAPFRALGALLGGGDEGHDTIRFAPGSAELAPPELEKLAKLAGALAARPQLGLTAHGAVDPAVDGRALNTAALATALDRELGRAPGTAPEPVDHTDAATQLALEALAEARDGEAAVDRFAEEFATREGRAAERINPLLGRLGRASEDAAFYRALFEHLVDTAPVPEDGLAALADARARAIVEAVGAAESIDGARLATGDPRTSEAQEGRVGVQLALDVRPGS